MKSLETQVGGSHYKGFAIQPAEYSIKNKLGFAEGNVVKYVTRFGLKGGLEDLHKARHYLDMLIEEAEKAEKETQSNSERFVLKWYLSPEERVWAEARRRALEKN